MARFEVEGICVGFENTSAVNLHAAQLSVGDQESMYDMFNAMHGMCFQAERLPPGTISGSTAPVRCCFRQQGSGWYCSVQNGFRYLSKASCPKWVGLTFMLMVTPSHAHKCL